MTKLMKQHMVYNERLFSGPLRYGMLILACGALLGTGSQAFGGDGSWVLNNSGNWSSTNNWDSGLVADGPGATGWFTNNITGARTVTLDTNSHALGILNVGDADTSHAFTIAANGGARLLFTNNGANAQLNQLAGSKGDTLSAPVALSDSLDVSNASTNVLILSGPVTNLTAGVRTLFNTSSGTGGLTVSGGIAANVRVVQNSVNGTLTLSSANSMTNGVLIRSGTLAGGNAASFGTPANVITIGDADGAAAQATLSVTAAITYPNPVTVASNNTGVAMIACSGVGTTLSGPVTLLNHDLTVFSSVSRLTLGNGVTGAGSLTLTNSGSSSYVTLTTAPVNPIGTISNTGSGPLTNSITGGVGSNVTAITENSASSVLSIGGLLTVNASGTVLANTSPGGSGTLTVSANVGGTGNLLLNNNSAIAGGITLAGATVTNIGRIINAGTGTGNTLISAAIGPAVTSVIQNSPTSRLVLSGANTYTGPTVISNGTLRVANATGSATGTGGVTVNNGATLEGTGSLSGPVTNTLGGTLSPGLGGAAGGTLTISNLVWNGGGILLCRISSLTNGEAGAGTDYGRLVVNNTLTAVPSGSNLVLRMDSLGQNLPFETNRNYSLKVLSYASASLNPADLTLDTNAFLTGGPWTLTNINNSIYVVCLGATADKNYWTGSGTSTNWATASNWSKGHAPLPGEDVEFDFRAQATCHATNAANNLGSLTVAPGYTGSVIFAANAVEGGMSLTVTNIVINGGSLVFAGDTTAQGDGTPGSKWGVGYTLNASNLAIAAGASLNSDNQGFAAGAGPGKPSANMWGASYGGRGGVRYSTNAFLVPSCYGTAEGPTALGSGGNTGGGNTGGGALKLVLTGAAMINGRLSASSTLNTQNYSMGSGGSIWITGGTLMGTGVIAANGGTGGNTPAAGGGGRIDLSGTTNNFAGSLQVLGGTPNGTALGLAGSILLPQSAGTGLTLDNFLVSSNITFGNSLTFTQPVTVTNGGRLTLEANSNENVHTFTSLTVASNGAVMCQGNVAMINPAAGGSATNPYGMGITLIATTVTINAGGSLNANGGGFYAAGPGFTTNYGGAYGGKSIHAVNPTYGSPANVTALGSGGYAGFGGGAIKLIVSGALTVDGTNACDGALSSVNMAAGSGGSLWIDCNTLQGAGVISARGGRGNQNEGGGGGRVYVVYDALGPVNPISNWTVSAYGGTGDNGVTNKGGAGTVLLINRPLTNSGGTLLVANDLPSSTNAVTELPAVTDTAVDEVKRVTLVASNRAQVSLTTDLTLRDLFLYTNAVLYLNGYTLQLNTVYHTNWGRTNWVVYSNGQILWRKPGTVLLLQ